jgi:hypothetical protein
MGQGNGSVDPQGNGAAMKAETILKIACPACGKVNYVNIGDVTDCTGTDHDGFVCWSCTGKFLFDEDSMRESWEAFGGDVTWQEFLEEASWKHGQGWATLQS